MVFGLFNQFPASLRMTCLEKPIAADLNGTKRDSLVLVSTCKLGAFGCLMRVR